MSSDSYRWYQQSDFRKGICVYPEDAEENQVLDASNIWAVNELAEVRPGVTGRLVMDPLGYPQSDAGGNTIIPYDSAGSLNVMYKETAAGVRTVIISGATIPIGTLNVGDSLTCLFNATAATNNVGGLFSFWLPMTVVNTNDTRWTLEVLTETRGFVGVECQGNYKFLGDTSKLSGSYYYQYFFFNSPKDAALNFSSYLGNAFVGDPGFTVRFRIMGSATSAGTTANYGAGVAGPLIFIQNFSNQQVVNNSFFRLQYASGTKVLGISTSDVSTTLNPGIVATAPPFVTYSERNTLLYESQQVYAGAYSGYANPNYTFRFANQFRALPPTVAVVPELNTAFSAYQNTIVEHPLAATYPPTLGGTALAYGPVAVNPYYVSGATTQAGPNHSLTYYEAKTAQTTTDQSLVGPLSIIPAPAYSTDSLTLDNIFPQANIICYFKNRLFVAGIKDQPSLVKWSGDSGLSGTVDNGLYVWPSTSQTNISTAGDNSEITALAPLGDNLIVFKKNSIWQLVYSGEDSTQANIAVFDAQLVVAGVGCIAHASVQAVGGSLLFLAEDGIYQFDGTTSVKRLSDDIRSYVERINPGRSSFATAIHWRTKQHYLLAVGLDGSGDSNNYVLAYDYQQNAWWVWTGWDVQCWYGEDGLGFREEIWFLDRYGRAFKLGWGSSDSGIPIETMLETQRFGFDDVLTKKGREIRLRGQNNNGPITFDIISDDISVIEDKQIDMPLDTESQYQNTLSTADYIYSGQNANLTNTGPAYGVAYAPYRRRERKHPILATSKWIQVKIYNALQILGIDIGYEPESRR